MIGSDVSCGFFIMLSIKKSVQQFLRSDPRWMHAFMHECMDAHTDGADCNVRPRKETRTLTKI